MKYSATNIALIKSRNYMSHFYKIVNYYYNIYKPVTTRQVNYKVN